MIRLQTVPLVSANYHECLQTIEGNGIDFQIHLVTYNTVLFRYQIRVLTFMRRLLELAAERCSESFTGLSHSELVSKHPRALQDTSGHVRAAPGQLISVLNRPGNRISRI